MVLACFGTTSKLVKEENASLIAEAATLYIYTLVLAKIHTELLTLALCQHVPQWSMFLLLPSSRTIHELDGVQAQ